jgi:putative SOS response-associated peptidase YedK
MCGRYVLAKPRCRSAVERDYFGGLDRFPERYNVAPTQIMPIARLVDGKLELTTARWGFPLGSSDETITYRTINARAETVATKPIFRDAYKSRRCLVPASGYYEWQTRSTGKQPYYFTSRDSSLLAFAGLWEQAPPDSDVQICFTIIVGEPNPFTQDVHDRMPIIIEPKDWNMWVMAPDPAALLKPCRIDLLQKYPVSPAVNNPSNDAPELIAPAGANRHMPADGNPNVPKHPL